MFDLAQFAIRLTILRKETGLSQQRVADGIEIPLRSYQRYEAGATEPRIEVLMRLADFFGVSLDSLVGRSCAED